MKAMVLAAGLGTRLRPLSNDRPKALMEIGGRTLLEITLTRLGEFGVQEVIVNAHHFAPRIVDYLKEKKNFGMRVEVSCEEVLLDTGGGLKKAGWFFTGTAPDGEEPFILHNVDVLSNIDLHRMLQFHAGNNALATLAVQRRESSRYLLFDGSLQLCGRKAGRDQDIEIRSAQELTPLAFSGIHIISTRMLRMLSEEGAFSIIDAYLRLAQGGERILAFRADQYRWRDLGTLQSLAAAEQDLKQDRD